MKKIISIVLISCSVFLSTAYGYNYINKNEILRLLQKEDFQAIDKQLSLLQQKYEADISKELEVQEAYTVFANSDPKLEQSLEKWVSAHPYSASSHIALGVYHYYLGWLNRGYRWAKDTNDKQFMKMRAHFRKANDELKKAVKINPKNTNAYSYLVSIAGVNNSNLKSTLDEALSHNPLSLIVRLNYLNFLEPKWGGSLDQIKRYIEEVKPLYAKNPLLKTIEGEIPYTKGDALYTTYEFNKVKESIAYFNDAVKKSGQNQSVILRRAEAYMFLGKYQKAMNDYNQLLKDNPHDVTTLTARARAYIAMGKQKKALEDAEKAILFDKFNPLALEYKGIALYSMNHFNESLQAFIDSFTYRNSSSTSHTYLGYIYYYQKKNYALASQELMKAIELGNDKSETLYLITVSQWHDRDCGFVKSAYKYKEVCTLNNDCDRKKLDWAIKSADFSIKRGVCKQ